MVAWQRWGMKERVLIAPPRAGGLTSVIFGTDFSVTSPRFIIGPTCSRMASSRALSAVSASSASRLSCPLRPKSAASMITQGMPLSIRVQSTPSMQSVTLPVGSSAPQLDPAVSLNSSGIAAAVPGTPSMAVSPA